MQVRHLEQYRINSIFRMFKLKAEYRLLEKQCAKRKLSAETGNTAAADDSAAPPAEP